MHCVLPPHVKPPPVPAPRLAWQEDMGTHDIEQPEPGTRTAPFRVEDSAANSTPTSVVDGINKGFFVVPPPELTLPVGVGGLFGDVWVWQSDSWALMHQFRMGLEFDKSSKQGVEAHRSQLHLPTASLTALEQLRQLFSAKGAVKLDVKLESDQRVGSVFDALLDLAVGQGNLSARGREEAKANLQRRFADRSQDPTMLLKGDEGRETIDVSVCPLQAFEPNQSPVVTMIGLSTPLRMDGCSGTSLALKYAALVLCPVTREGCGFAASMACGLAGTFMDDVFVKAVRALPPDQPEGVLGAFDTYLSCVTVVPTVYVPSAKPRDEALEESQEPESEYLLSDSLARTLHKIVRNNAHDLPVVDDVAQPLQPAKKSHGAFPLQVNAFSPVDSQWSVTQCLRQGLEVDMASGEARPHLPSVSMRALASVRKLINLASVALDVSMGSLDKSIDLVANQLSTVGLPTHALPEVKRVLQIGSDGSRVKSPKAVLSHQMSTIFEPSEEDETCQIFEIPHASLKPSQGVFGAFFRFRDKGCLPFVSSSSPSKFLFILVGSQNPEIQLADLGHSLAVLATDEDLMERLSSANDAKSFVGAIDDRLSNLTVISNHYASLDKIRMARPTATMKESHQSKAPSRAKSEISRLPTLLDGPSELPPKEGCCQKVKWLSQMMQKYSMPLVLGVIAALVWSNAGDDGKTSHYDATHKAIIKGAKLFGHDLSLHFIVNDIFMVFFFGLAIKEVTEAVLPGGSLSPLSRAINPLMATIGGVVGPVVAYIVCVLLFDAAGFFDNTMCEKTDDASGAHRLLAATSSASVASAGKELCSMSVLIKGWGVPTATDISLAWMFALIIYGAGHPAINVLLLLAIVDDAIGMVIIATAYPNPEKPVEPVWLLLVVGGMIVAAGLRRLRVMHWQVYVFLAGPIAWLGLIKAHVHPALALGFVVPFMPASMKKPKHKSVEETTPDMEVGHDGEADAEEEEPLSPGFEKTRKAVSKVASMMEESAENRRKAVLKAAELLTHLHSAPLHAFEHALKMPVDFGMFFFGLANAGVQLGTVGGVTAAVIIALLVGKTLGIAAFSLLAVRLGFNLPAGVSVCDLFALSALGGVGLTVALFVSNEAFVDPGLKGQAKMGAVLSVSSGGLAWLIKFMGDRCWPASDLPDEESESEEEEATVDSDVDAQEFEDLLVDDIMQVMWTVRKYRARGAKMPLTERNLRAASKRSVSRAASKSAGAVVRTPSKGDWVRTTSKGSAQSACSEKSLTEVSSECSIERADTVRHSRSKASCGGSPPRSPSRRLSAAGRPMTPTLSTNSNRRQGSKYNAAFPTGPDLLRRSVSKSSSRAAERSNKEAESAPAWN